jgi:hypothetical protein
MNRVLRILTDRYGVFRTWPSFVRVATWSLVWTLAISAVLAPSLPTHTDREHSPDNPPSNVRYVGPISRSDFAGFLPPDHTDGSFTVAWIGGSEVKLGPVSVPGAVENRIDTVGGRPLLIDSYNVIAPRLIDMLRAVDTAVDHDADAIVIALNPAWVRSEWSMRDWTNLDVSNLGLLFERPATATWGALLTSPADVAWRASRALIPLVEVQSRLNERADDESEALDLIVTPDEPVATDRPDPRLPTEPSTFWITQAYGPERVEDDDVRVRTLMEGIGPSRDEARFFIDALVDRLDDADIPVFLYTTIFNPASLADPEFDAAARDVEAFWASVATDIEDPLIEIASRSMSRDFDSAGLFIDHVHMNDAQPFAEVLVERLCAQWNRANPDWSCT